MKLTTKKIRKTAKTNEIIKSITQTISHQRQRISSLMKNTTNESTAQVISGHWWQKWFQLPNDIQLSSIDPKQLNDILFINGNHLIMNNNQNPMIDNIFNEEYAFKQQGMIDVPCVYLYPHSLKCNLIRNKDYMLIPKEVSHELRLMRYSIKPKIFVKRVLYYNEESKDMYEDYELYKSQFIVHFHGHGHHTLSSLQLNSNNDDDMNVDGNEMRSGTTVILSSSLTETIRKIKTWIARYFVIQASSIRLRRGELITGEILDESHTLSQLEVARIKDIYVEVRLPNGCWPTIELLEKYHETKPRKKINISNNNSRNISTDEQKIDESLIEVMKQLNVKQKSISEVNKQLSINSNDNTPTNTCRTCQRLIKHYIRCKQPLNGKECPAVYCNMHHQLAHAKFHSYEHIPYANGEYPIMRWGAVGLNNLGNSCYMNSSLQCLSFVCELRSYLVSDDWEEDVNEDNPLGYRGQLAKYFSDFLKNTWFGHQEVYSPKNMRKGIAHLKDTWNSVEQQDAQEFVGWLLDGLHEDLNLIKEKPYYELPDSNGRPDRIVADEHWFLHLKRNQSIIVDLFQGQYKSTLQCPNCDYTSVKFDPFLTISLPIPSPDTQFPIECLVFTGMSPHRLTVNVSSKASVIQLTQSIGEKLSLDYRELLMCKVSNHEFRKYWRSGRELSVIANNTSRAKPVHIYRVMCTTIASRNEMNIIQIRMNFAVMNNNERQYFAPPLVMDINAPLTGQQLYCIFRETFLNSFVKDELLSSDPPIPAIQMLLKTDADNYVPIGMSDSTSIPLTNEYRNVATIIVQFSNDEYCRYIDHKKANLFLDSEESDATPKNYVDIYDCFKMYTAAEVLDEAVWKCSHCRKVQRPSKQLHLWRMPEILIIHLKRFSNSVGYFNYGKKIQKLVVFPIYGLDISKYLAESVCDGDGNGMEIEHIPKYDLIGTVNHYGMMSYGHYYACVRTDYSTEITNFYDHFLSVDEPLWRIFNDEAVGDIEQQEIYDRYMGDAYLLFYKRRNRVE